MSMSAMGTSFTRSISHFSVLTRGGRVRQYSFNCSSWPDGLQVEHPAQNLGPPQDVLARPVAAQPCDQPIVRGDDDGVQEAEAIDAVRKGVEISHVLAVMTAHVQVRDGDEFHQVHVSFLRADKRWASPAVF